MSLSSIVVFIVLALVVCNQASTFAQSVDNTPIVVFREDDCRGDWRTPYNGLDGYTALEYGKLKQIPITWGVIAAYATYCGNIYLSWSDLRGYLDKAGGEPASHSYKHAQMSSTKEYIDELVKSKQLIQQNLPGHSCTTFLQPGPWTGYAYLDQFAKLGNEVGEAIKSNYQQSQAYLGSGWIVGNQYYLYGMTNIYGLDYGAGATIPSLMAMLDVVAATPGAVFMTACHGVQESGGTDEQRVQADLMKAYMDKLADLRDAGKIRLMSMNDAYHAQFSTDINHIPDAGFETCTPGTLNPVGPWWLYDNTTISNSDGIGGTRCLKTIGGSSSYFKCGNLVLPPGKYQLSWSQKTLAGYNQNKFLSVSIYASTRPSVTIKMPMKSALFSNSSGGWEQKAALLIVQQQYPHCNIQMTPSTGAAYYVDNLSLVYTPVDPAVSPSNSNVQAYPGGCTVSWDTPHNSDVSKVYIQRSYNTNPVSLNDGFQAGSVDAIASTRQQIDYTNNWTTQPYLYFSIFAVDKDGNASPPELAATQADSTPPSSPSISFSTLADSSIMTSWTAVDTDSAVYAYSYALGSTPGGNDILSWTQTTDTSAVISESLIMENMYVSVKAENLFGYWSPVSTVNIHPTASIPDALSSQDGNFVVMYGTVSAVFADCIYVQQNDCRRGIRVIGFSQTVTLGDTIKVCGKTGTVNGERVILVQNSQSQSSRAAAGQPMDYR